MAALKEQESSSGAGPAVMTPPKPVLWTNVNPVIAKNLDITIKLAGAKTADLLTAAEKGGDVKLPGNLNIRMKEVFGHNERAKQEIMQVNTDTDAVEFLKTRFNIEGSGDPRYLIDEMKTAAGLM